MIKLKAVFLVCMAFVLSACTEQALLAPDVASRISVQEINVETSQLPAVTGRSIEISTAQVRDDIQRALRSRLQGRGAPSGDAVGVTVNVDRVALVSPGQSLLIGGVSSITARVSITNLATGALVLPETVVTSRSEGYAPGGLIGAASRSSPEADYTQTVTSFSNNVAARILGNVGATTAAPLSNSNSSVPSATTSTPGGQNNQLRASAWQL